MERVSPTISSTAAGITRCTMRARTATRNPAIAGRRRRAALSPNDRYVLEELTFNWPVQGTDERP
jgi:hypothetical protein